MQGVFTKFLVGGGGKLAFGDNFQSLSGMESDGYGGLASGTESDGGGGEIGKKLSPYSKIRANFGVLSIELSDAVLS